MSWSAYTHAEGIIQLAVLIIGLCRGVYQLSLYNATRHLGLALQNEDEVGYFIAKPHWSHWLFPLYIPTVRTPRIPTLRSIIRAGDEGIFTSGMIHRIAPRQDSITENHFTVSWKPIYQAFFQEYVWAMDQYQPNSFAPLKKVLNREGKELGKYNEKAEHDVWKAKRIAEGRRVFCVRFHSYSCVTEERYVLALISSCAVFLVAT